MKVTSTGSLPLACACAPTPATPEGEVDIALHAAVKMQMPMRVSHGALHSGGPVRYEAQTRADDGTLVHDVTDLLLSWRHETAALDRGPARYGRAAWRAAISVRSRPRGLRLVDVDRMTLTSRTHFFGVAATLMRQILVDHARRQRADKRGGGATMLSLDEVSPAAQASSVDVLALDQALDALSSIDGRQCRVVELRFFAGLNIDERQTRSAFRQPVEREWALAKAWLYRHLSSHA